METINFPISPFSLDWKWGVLPVLDIAIPLLAILYLTLFIKFRYERLSRLVFKEENKTYTCHSFTKDLIEKILRKNRFHHVLWFLFSVPLFFLSFFVQKEWGASNLLLAIFISSLLFVASCAISRERLKKHRKKVLAESTEKKKPKK